MIMITPVEGVFYILVNHEPAGVLNACRFMVLQDAWMIADGLARNEAGHINDMSYPILVDKLSRKLYYTSISDQISRN